MKRKALLAQLLAGQPAASSAIQFSDHVVGDGAALYEQASELGLEGIVSKRADAPYQSGALEDLAQGQGAASRRLRHRRLHGVGRRRGACGARRSANGSTASCSIAARSAPASTPRRSRDLLARLRAAATTGATHARRRAEGHDLGAAGAGGAHPLCQPAPRDNSLRHAVFKGLRDVETVDAGARPSASG